MHLSVPITTERLVLRTLEEGDVTERYLGWLRDPAVNRYLEVRFDVQTLETCRTFVLAANQHADTLLLGIFLKEGTEERRHIGNIKLGPINPHHRRAELGLLLGDRAEWGKGYGSEAIVAMTRHAFAHLGLHKVTAGCYGGNHASAGAFLKAGYHEAARRPQHWLCEGEWQDDIILECFEPPSPIRRTLSSTGDEH